MMFTDEETDVMRRLAAGSCGADDVPAMAALGARIVDSDETVDDVLGAVRIATGCSDVIASVLAASLVVASAKMHGPR